MALPIPVAPPPLRPAPPTTASVPEPEIEAESDSMAIPAQNRVPEQAVDARRDFSPLLAPVAVAAVAPLAPVAPSASVPHREVEVLRLAEALASRVRFAGAQPRLWTVLAPLVGLLLLGVAAGAAAGAWRLGDARRTAAPSATAVAPSVADPVLPPATQHTPPDVAALEAKPPESRSADEVLALATAASERERAAARLFRDKLARDPSAVKGKDVLAELRKLTADPNTAHEALAAVAALPGPVSADLLYEIWTATPNRTDATELARALLYSRDVRAKASDALSVALDLRETAACAANRALLPRALQVGDRRSLSLLLKLQRKQGCGPNKKQDCFACLRDDGKEELDAAITAVKSRKAPNPLGGA